MKRIICAAALFVLSSVICLMPAKSQSQAATVSGVVSDPEGRFIPGVTVAATKADTQAVVKTITNGDGKYSFASLQPGTYEVRVSLTGFVSDSVQKPLISGESAQLNFTMKIASSPDNGGPGVTQPDTVLQIDPIEF